MEHKDMAKKEKSCFNCIHSIVCIFRTEIDKMLLLLGYMKQLENNVNIIEKKD